MNKSNSLLRVSAAAVLMAGTVLMVSGPVMAQGLARPSGPVVGTAEFPTKAPPPRALPGARTDSGSPAPLDRAPSDMKPNEALFDAINRGDTVAARDAIGRGADPDSRNILGLTPIDLAVDLGRNDITFLLLALRGSGSSSAAATTAARSPASTSVAARNVEARPMPVSNRPVAAASANAGPQQIMRGSNPGIPAPQAGFLGFGGAALR